MSPYTVSEEGMALAEEMLRVVHDAYDIAGMSEGKQGDALAFLLGVSKEDAMSLVAGARDEAADRVVKRGPNTPGAREVHMIAVGIELGVAAERLRGRS